MRRFGFTLPAIALAVGLAVPAAAQGPTLTAVVTGLDSPRGVALGPDGTIYVAEVGTGGTENCIDHVELGHMCFGNTGGISSITDGTATRVVDGLISGVTDTGETLGMSDVAVADDGTIWFTLGGPAAGAAELRDSITGGEDLGHVFRVTEGGEPEAVADFAAYETENNPDADQPGNQEPDSNLNSLAPTADGLVVADAGANTLYSLDPSSGEISVVAIFPVVMMDMPAPPRAPAGSPEAAGASSAAPASPAAAASAAAPPQIPMDPVPTSVVVGPDGAYYVGQLTGFPFPPGGASVFRVTPEGEVSTYASGFTNVIDVAFGTDGSLYVLEIARDGLLSADPAAGPPAGGLWRVPPDGGTPERIEVEGLVMPGGMAAAPDGSLYISTCAVCPDAGSIVNVTP
jgi:sugar lactone lactonase YvrE